MHALIQPVLWFLLKTILIEGSVKALHMLLDKVEEHDGSQKFFHTKPTGLFQWILHGIGSGLVALLLYYKWSILLIITLAFFLTYGLRRVGESFMTAH
jgi:energy-coupling factor transporter transmembrane protein EcfT